MSFHVRTMTVVLAAVLSGCGKTPPLTTQARTGAEDVARKYFESLLHGDWSAAYDMLDGESKASCRQDRFASLAVRYQKQFGFKPSEVHVSVSESEDRATAVGVYKGMSGTAPIHRKDGTALRRTADGWAVVLRENFGKESPLKPAPR